MDAGPNPVLLLQAPLLILLVRYLAMVVGFARKPSVGSRKTDAGTPRRKRGLMGVISQGWESSRYRYKLAPYSAHVLTS